MKTPKTKQPKWEDYFAPGEVNRNVEDYTGKVMILSPACLAPAFRKREMMLWRAVGGFGCSPVNRGQAVLATCLADNEEARWNRNDFIGEYVPTPQA